MLLCEGIAAVYATLGDTGTALDWLDRAVRAAGNEQAEWFQRNPLLANIQQQPRFKQIVESIAYRRGRGRLRPDRNAGRCLWDGVDDGVFDLLQV